MGVTLSAYQSLGLMAQQAKKPKKQLNKKHLVVLRRSVISLEGAIRIVALFEIRLVRGA
jgi:hypothetical protein